MSTVAKEVRDFRIHSTIHVFLGYGTSTYGRPTMRETYYEIQPSSYGGGGYQRQPFYESGTRGYYPSTYGAGGGELVQARNFDQGYREVRIDDYHIFEVV